MQVIEHLWIMVFLPIGNYIYEIIPYTGNELGSPIVTDEIFTDFFGYYLMNIDGTDNVYKF